MSKVDIVLVHTGNYFYDYINDCIYQLNKYNFNVHIIISEKLKSKINSNVNIYIEEDLLDDSISSFSIKNIDNNFRDGFWNRCSSRFLLLAKYAKIKNLENFFHIENDVLLFSNFEDIKTSSMNTEKDLLIIADSFNRCVPSVVFFKNKEICQELSDFIINNNTVSDMHNLFLFFENNRNRVDNFPIFPDGFSDKYFIENKNINFQNGFNNFNSIFDGAAIGQYLGGIDPVNSGFRETIGFVNESCIFKVSKYKYIWENNEPFILVDNKKVKINNLHIHSKNLKMFIKTNR